MRFGKKLPIPSMVSETESRSRSENDCANRVIVVSSTRCGVYVQTQDAPGKSRRDSKLFAAPPSVTTMSLAAHTPITQLFGLDPRPRSLSLSELLGLPRVRAPRRLIEATLHAMSELTTASSKETGGSSSTAAAGVTHAEDPDDLDPDAPREKGPFAAGVVSMEDLIREHSDAVYRVALSVTRDPVLAEDVSQDALIKAWQALPSFRGDSPLRNWILRITHNTAISTLRKRRDELREPDKLPERVVYGSVESQVQDRLAIDRFEEALADLDSVSRSIVVLREVEGLSYAELCDVLDLPMPTIKTRLLRARRQLAQALDGWQP